MSDLDLLRQYARESSEAAFTTLVEHHVDLVYSVAHRLVRSPQLAEEVTQSVFIDLARNAARFNPRTPLVAWLHVVSRRTAIDVVRRESRRQLREREALEIASMKATPNEWTEVEPLLDEAVATLPATDRAAILLRYFENKSLREIGEVLGTSDGAAQKRVSRALEQLRTFFAKRGVVLTAPGLVNNLTAHAVTHAPAGLAAPITTVAALATAAGSTATLEAAKIFAMTTIQKSALAVAFAVAASATLYEAVVIYRQEAQVSHLQEHIDGLTAEMGHLQVSRDIAAARLKEADRQIDRRLSPAANAVTASDTVLEAQMKDWLAQLDRLRQFIAQRPNLKIPELAFLTDEDWFSVATDGRLVTDEEVRRAAAHLRRRAENFGGHKLMSALNAYLKANDGKLPDTPLDLAPFLDPSVDPSLLQRYEILHTGKLSELPPRDQSYGLVAVRSPIDVEYDTFWRVGVSGFTATTAMNHNVSQARQQFAKAHNGQQTNDATQLMPYLKWPVDPVVLQKHLNPPSPGNSP